MGMNSGILFTLDVDILGARVTSEPLTSESDSEVTNANRTIFYHVNLSNMTLVCQRGTWEFHGDPTTIKSLAG